MKYNSQINPHGFVSVNEFITDKYDKIHKELYNNALGRYLSEQYAESVVKNYPNEDKYFTTDNYYYIEIPDAEYQNPSSVMIISKTFPFTKEIVSLEQYWNTYQQDMQDGTIKNLSDLMIDEETLNDAQIIHIDYARATVTLHSKTTDKEFTVPFEYVNENTPISLENTLYGTFMYKLKNKIYGG